MSATLEVPAVPRTGALPERPVALLRLVAVAAAVVTGLGLVLAPERTWRGVLTGELLVLGLGVGAAVFVALQHVTGAGWSVVLRRVPEAMARGGLPVAAALFALPLLGVHALYEWTHDAPGDAVLRAKAAWLNVPFFAARAVAILGVWVALARAITRDADGEAASVRRTARLSGVFLAVFAPTFTIAAFDWVQSLQPHWFSTIFAVYHWAGLFLGTLAAVTLAAVALRRARVLPVTTEHLHELGRLTLGFSTFWAYVWFSQFMLIWYSNLPEERTYFAERAGDRWLTPFVANLVVNWAIPFLALLPRSAKRSEVVLVRVCALLLLGRWLDLYLDVSQPVLRDGPAFGPWEVAPVVGCAAAFVLGSIRAFGSAAPVPRRDPYLGESLDHRA